MYQKLNQLLHIGVIVSLLTACNSGGEHPLRSKSTPAVQQQSYIKSSEIVWTVDNSATDRELNITLKDLGWHLISLTFAPQKIPPHPIEVGGLIAGIYPNPVVKVGQQILIRDLNCANALFGKSGDSCRAYFKLSYDTSKSSNSPIDFPIQIALKAKLDGLLAFTATIQPSLSIADYRVVKSDEEQYYRGRKVANKRGSYQILLVQNGSLAPIQMTKIPTPHNPAFALRHRSTCLESDPYYGPEAECSLNERPELKQVKHLAKLNQRCILIYQAAESATNSVESEAVRISSNADYIFPARSDKYLLQSNYSAGKAIPAEPVNSLHGKLLVPYPVKSFKLNYNFQPTLLPIHSGSSGSTLILHHSADVWLNEPILTSLNIPAKITAISKQYPEASVVAENNLRVTACGGAHAEAHWYVTIYDSYTRQGQVAVHQDINSSGNCGGDAPANFDVVISLDGFDQTIYHVDHTGCEGGNWDMGGTVRLRGNCAYGSCNYVLDVSAHHGGVGGQCHDDQTRSINFSFADPRNILAELSPANPQFVKYAGQGGQTARGSIGNNSGQLKQKTNCGQSGFCSANASFHGWPGERNLSYLINLNPGDVFGNGVIEFTRSSGYDLDSFELKQREREGLVKVKQ